jgi:hypothetical protein
LWAFKSRSGNPAMSSSWTPQGKLTTGEDDELLSKQLRDLIGNRKSRLLINIVNLSQIAPSSIGWNTQEIDTSCQTAEFSAGQLAHSFESASPATMAVRRPRENRPLHSGVVWTGRFYSISTSPFG